MSVARWSLRSKALWIARSSQCVSASDTGTIFVYGGELKPRTPVDSADHQKDGIVRGSVHLFDLGRAQPAVSARGWNTAFPAVTTAAGDSAGIPEPRVGATTVYDRGFLYLWGGRGGVDMAPLEPAQAGMWRGELTTNGDGISWKRLAPGNVGEEPSPRSYHTSVAYKGMIYVHAGCPVSGRLNTLHSFDTTDHTWKSLAPGPDPVRGGTTLAVAELDSPGILLLRYGGFSGYELPSSPGSIDIYSIMDDKWLAVQPAADPVHGNPGPRSVSGFTSLQSTSPALRDAVAVLFHGERDASTLGHAGAGTFWDDVWVLTKNKELAVSEGWAWKYITTVAADGKILPEGRGWFASAGWVDGNNTRIVMQGGLLSSNERSDELWELEIE